MCVGRKYWENKFHLFVVGKSLRIVAKVAIILITPLVISSIFTSLDSSWRNCEVHVIWLHSLL